MAYGSKSAAQGYTAFNKTAGNPDSSDDSTDTNNTENMVVQNRKKAIKKRLLSMRGN